MNEKVFIYYAEFKKSGIGSIIPLYPNVSRVKGKWFIINVGSGTGKLNKTILVCIQILGFILYPGFPNMTVVTQETDQN